MEKIEYEGIFFLSSMREMLEEKKRQISLGFIKKVCIQLVGLFCVENWTRYCIYTRKRKVDMVMTVLVNGK